MWEEQPDAKEVALVRHDALLRGAIERGGGVVFKSVGDAFCAVFAVASDCVRAAAMGQPALQEEAWPSPVKLCVPIAIHTGECTQLGELESARRQADESLAIARALEAPLLIVCALEAVAAVKRAEGDTTSASSALEEARSVARTVAVPGAYLSSVTRKLGELAGESGHQEQATMLLTETADVAHAVGDSWGLARATSMLDRRAALLWADVRDGGES